MSDLRSTYVEAPRMVTRFLWAVIAFILLLFITGQIDWGQGHPWITIILLLIIILQQKRIGVSEEDLSKIRELQVQQEKHHLDRLIDVEKRVSELEQG